MGGAISVGAVALVAIIWWQSAGWNAETERAERLEQQVSQCVLWPEPADMEPPK